MKSVEVVAAIIEKEGKYFATQRGYGDFKDGWEFPGGKVEPGEQPEQAIIREIKEELESTVSIIKFLCTVEHDYPKFHLIMHCYLCQLEEGNLHLVEHEAARWLLPEQIDSVDWLPADIKVVNALKKELGM
jgi:8-oxo-dGTP diphosphatase